SRFFPEIGDAGVKRVEGVESTNLLRAAEIDRDKKPHAPGAECFGDSNKLRQKAGCNYTRISIDVVDRARVDPHRCHQARIIAHPSEIRGDIPLFEEYRWSGVAALDRAVQIIPFINHSDRRIWVLGLVKGVDGFAQSYLTQQGKGAVQHSSVTASGDY